MALVCRKLSHRWANVGDCQLGELHVPLEVCGAVVKRELDYWHVDEFYIKSCCWRHYRSYIENKRILDSFNRSLLKENIFVNLESLTGWKRVQMRLWLILEHPRTSKVAMIYGIISLVFVVTSILGFCLETLPFFKPMPINRTGNGTCDGVKPRSIGKELSPHEALNILDIICTVFFTIELIVRFIFAPDKLKFVISAMNIIDLLALVPLYMQLIFNYGSILICYQDERLMVEIMFILRIVRMFRIFHLVKHYQALKILVYALKASIQELLMLAIFLIIGTLIFATMIYYAERRDGDNPVDKFQTIPIGFWWAIMTMTTVGYGDVYPVSPVGYIVGAACGVSGVLMIALTIPVISNNFTLFYTHVRSRKSDKPRDFTSSDESLDTNDENNEAKKKDYARKMSNGSIITDTLMNGKTMLKDLGKRTKYVPMAKFSEANSMTDIVVKRCESEEKGLTRTVSINAHSDDGIAYSGETML